MSTGHPDEWYAGLESGIAWDAITAYYVFTPEQYERKMKTRAGKN